MPEARKRRRLCVRALVLRKSLQLGAGPLGDDRSEYRINRPVCSVLGVRLHVRDKLRDHLFPRCGGRGTDDGNLGASFECVIIVSGAFDEAITEGPRDRVIWVAARQGANVVKIPG